jgi:hypothetical protein
MITPQLRPRLEMTVRMPPEEVATRIDRRLQESDCPCRGLATSHQIDLRIREADRTFWSPQLVVIISPETIEDRRASRLVGHFGPNANVWSMFLAVYGFVVISATIGVFFGLSQLMLDRPPWALWSIPVAGVLVVLIYTAAGIGQRLGHDQVNVLKTFLESMIGEELEAG